MEDLGFYLKITPDNRPTTVLSCALEKDDGEDQCIGASSCSCDDRAKNVLAERNTRLRQEPRLIMRNLALQSATPTARLASHTIVVQRLDAYLDVEEINEGDPAPPWRLNR